MAPSQLPLGSGYSPNLMPSPDSPMRHHHRAPSLGELHQELESEQEGQVNRLLGMIRQQQAQIQSLQSHGTTQQANGDGSAISRSTTPTPATTPAATPSSLFAPPSHRPRSRTPSGSSFSNSSRPSSIGAGAGTAYQSSGRPPPPLNRHSSSRTHLQAHNSQSQHGLSLPSPSHLHNPNAPLSFPPHAIRPPTPNRNSSFDSRNPTASIDAQSSDEIGFYRTEAASIERENRMLRARIKQLEDLCSERRTEASNVATEDIHDARNGEESTRGRQST